MDPDEVPEHVDATMPGTRPSLPDFPVTRAAKVIIFFIFVLDFCLLQWKLSAPTRSYPNNDTNDKASSHKKLHLILLFMKSVEDKFTLKQRLSNSSTGCKISVVDWTLREQIMDKLKGKCQGLGLFLPFLVEVTLFCFMCWDSTLLLQKQTNKKTPLTAKNKRKQKKCEK